MRFCAESDFPGAFEAGGKVKCGNFLPSGVDFGKDPFQPMCSVQKVCHGKTMLIITAFAGLQRIVCAEQEESFAEFAVEGKFQNGMSGRIRAKVEFTAETFFLIEVRDGDRSLAADRWSGCQMQFSVDLLLCGEKVVGCGGLQISFHDFSFEWAWCCSLFQLEGIHPDESAAVVGDGIQMETGRFGKCDIKNKGIAFPFRSGPDLGVSDPSAPGACSETVEPDIEDSSRSIRLGIEAANVFPR